VELNDIKKLLYREKPKANLSYIRKGVAHYEAVVTGESIGSARITTIRFEVKVDDMGDADFLPTMDAQLLVRYISNSSSVSKY
jgi:hypothetical protein